jgi:hypothetical protein
MTFPYLSFKQNSIFNLKDRRSAIFIDRHEDTGGCECKDLLTNNMIKGSNKLMLFCRNFARNKAKESRYMAFS